MKKNILCLIPARSGSKGVKNKNIRNLENKPLISYTIEAARKSDYLKNENIICSTDSQKIAKIAEEYGAKAPFLRPKKYATDEAKSIDVAKHAVKWMKEEKGKSFDLLLLLQPTSPLRKSKHIDKAIENIDGDASSIISVKKTDEMPFNMKKYKEGYLEDFTEEKYHQRQAMPDLYTVNGAIYLTKIKHIKEDTFFGPKAKPIIMDKEESIDIDKPIDMKIAEFLIRNRDKETHLS